MASSILLDRNPQYYDIQRHIVPFTDYSPWERRKSSNTRRYSAATRTPTRSRPKTPSKGQTKSAISAKDYLLKVYNNYNSLLVICLLFVIITMTTVRYF